MGHLEAPGSHGPAHVVQGIPDASQPGISEPAWKAPTDSQGFTWGSSLHKAVPPARHQVKEAQGRPPPAHPTVVFLHPSLKDPSILAPNCHCPMEEARPTPQHPAPEARPASACCSWGPEAAAPWMGWAESRCWVWSSGLDVQHTAAARKLRVIPPASPQRGVCCKSCFRRQRDEQHGHTGSTPQELCISPLQHPDVHSGGFMGAGSSLAAKLVALHSP